MAQAVGYDDDRYSLLTSTDSTLSNLSGAGSTLGSWLSAGGRLVDDLISDVAQRSGYGPNAVAARILCVEDVNWSACRCCQAKAARGLKKLRDFSKLVIVDIFDYLLIFDCSECRRDYATAVLQSSRLAMGCSKLAVQAMKSVFVYASSSCY
jgi:hypothetical protein